MTQNAPSGARPPARPPLPAGPLGAALALCAALALSGAPAARADDADLCLTAALDAHRLSGVPLSVLLGVTLTETGRGEPARPWPWTVNLEGEGHWFATRDEAVAFAEEARAAGRTSFDVGCFQLNWRWHGENFTGVAQMFDPLANASYAAGYLQTLAADRSGWSEAAGAYHSFTPEHANRYRATFDAYQAAAAAAGADEGRLAGAFALAETQVAATEAPGPAGAPRVNQFPLLRAGGTPRLGSLVPLGDG